MASIYKRGDDWYGNFIVNGKRQQLRLDTKSERVAIAWKKSIEAAGRMKLLPEPTRTPLIPTLQSFCTHLKATCHGWQTDFSRLRGFFGPCCEPLHCPPHTPERFRQEPGTLRFNVKLLEEISALTISQELTERVADEELNPNTANKYREILQRLFNFAMTNYGYVCPDTRYKNPVEGVTMFKTQLNEIIWLTMPQIEEQLAAVHHDTIIHAVVATLIYAGLRRSEAIWLTDADVDLKTRLIHIREKSDGDVTWRPKTRGSKRAVPISSTLLAYLFEYLHQRGASRNGWFFPAPEGGRWDADNFSDALRSINEKAKLTWSSLDLRHTFGSHLAQAGKSLFKIATLMGNSPEICRRHYAALVPEAMHGDVEFHRLNETVAESAGTDLKCEVVSPSGAEAPPDSPRLRLAR